MVATEAVFPAETERFLGQPLLAGCHALAFLALPAAAMFVGRVIRVGIARIWTGVHNVVVELCLVRVGVCLPNRRRLVSHVKP